jgi:nickel-dependent lactate racemase
MKSIDMILKNAVRNYNSANGNERFLGAEKMSVYIEVEQPDEALDSREQFRLLAAGLEKAMGGGKDLSRVAVISVDVTRLNGRSGDLVNYLYVQGVNIENIFLSLGSHEFHSRAVNRKMFGDIPESLFVNHNWNDVTEVGRFPRSYLEELCSRPLDFLPEEIPVELNTAFYEGMKSGRYTCCLSFGPVFPHEVVGFSNGVKNRWVGIGGRHFLDASHSMMGLGYGMENTLGVLDTPLRKLLNRATEDFIPDFDIIDVLTVLGADEDGFPCVKGFFMGDDFETHAKAAALSEKLNVDYLDEAAEDVVVYLDPDEYKSFWLGNKAVYRTGMGIARGGRLHVLAPGVRSFSDSAEQGERERLIEEVGYKGLSHVRKCLESTPGLKDNLSVAAHCVHGSPLMDDGGDPLFEIIYYTNPNHMPRKRVENAGFKWGDYGQVEDVSLPDSQGFHDNFGIGRSKKVYFVPDPGMALLKVK